MIFSKSSRSQWLCIRPYTPLSHTRFGFGPALEGSEGRKRRFLLRFHAFCSLAGAICHPPPPTAFYPPTKTCSEIPGWPDYWKRAPPSLTTLPPLQCAASYSTVHLSRACVAGALHTALQLPRTCVAATLYLRSRWHRIAAPLQRSAVQLRHSSGEGRAFRCWLVVAEHGPFEQRIS